MAKISLVSGRTGTLWAEADGNVCQFVLSIAQIRRDRRLLHGLVQELVAELGPVDEDEVAEMQAIFTRIDAENARVAAARKGRSSSA
jgi:hypothetical protein